MRTPFGKPIQELTLEDIQMLIGNQVPESRTLDYKRDLYSDKTKGKRDFLCDVTAFANTVGGCLVIGVDERAGVPTGIPGVELEDFDKLRLTWEHLLRDCTDPPLRSLEMHQILLESGKSILIIHVPRSLARPHAVRHDKYFRFHGRNTTGNYPYEVDAIRRAVLDAETTTIRIKNFRNDRLSLIAVGQTPTPIGPDAAKSVLHVIPLSAFEMNERVDLRTARDRDLMFRRDRLPAVRYNLDGRLAGDGKWGYVQLFRNGIIEAVDVSLLTPSPDQWASGRTVRRIASELEETVIVATSRYLELLRKLEIDSPVYVALALLNVRGYSRGEWSSSIDRDDVIIPEQLIHELNTHVPTILKPIFDSLCNACGLEEPH